MYVSSTQVAQAADEVREALKADVFAFSQDEMAEVELYWKLVRLVATESDTQAVAAAVMFTLRETVDRLIAERATVIAMAVEEDEERMRSDRRNSLAYHWSAQ